VGLNWKIFTWLEIDAQQAVAPEARNRNSRASLAVAAGERRR